MLAPMKKVLLVEDMEDDRRAIRQIVDRMMNVKLLEAGNGADGLRMARTAQPRVILMDLSLPVVDGWAAIAQLKADPRTAGIPVVALTAHAMQPDEMRARAAGCDLYLAKPLDAASFRSTLEQLLADEAPKPRLT